MARVAAMSFRQLVWLLLSRLDQGPPSFGPGMHLSLSLNLFPCSAMSSRSTWTYGHPTILVCSCTPGPELTEFHSPGDPCSTQQTTLFASVGRTKGPGELPVKWHSFSQLTVLMIWLKPLPPFLTSSTPP